MEQPIHWAEVIQLFSSNSVTMENSTVLSFTLLYEWGIWSGRFRRFRILYSTFLCSERALEQGRGTPAFGCVASRVCVLLHVLPTESVCASVTRLGTYYVLVLMHLS